MSITTKRTLAMVLVLVQLFMLCPVFATTAEATQTALSTGNTPILNKTIVGTVEFQSFNFLGDNDTGEDGTDYQTTFYYSDDYFSPSAINDNPNITDPDQTWEMLDNPSLAACSMDFAVASYTSAEGDVIRSSSQMWNNTDYDGTKGKADPEYGKAVNAINFLTDCKFTNIEPHALNERPTNDSIGYTLGSKVITVWNAETQKNETYTLIAVGVRGAGYGAEWASNITIGDPATNALPANGRHYGFDHSAQIVCEGIRSYLNSHNITGNVKYWVTGFSRAAAVANLVAGYLTDGESTYQTQKKDVYGYTYECPQAASTIGENALDYKNIHNILNPMDAVPKVSPSEFNHQRLGVDYQMPYHGNASTNLNDTMYRQMFEVLKTIAVGNGTDPDPLVDDKTTSAANDGYVSPDVYPYNKPMTIYKMSGSQLVSDAFNNKLTENFGLVTARGNVDVPVLGTSDGGWYIDDFVDNLIDVFLTSDAWVGGAGNHQTPIENRATFISDYQSDLRTLLGYFLDFSGPAFMGMLDKLMDALSDKLALNISNISNVSLGLAFYNFYNDPTGTYKHSLRYTPLYAVYRLAGWWNQTTRAILTQEAKKAAVEVANNMVSGFPNPEYQRIYRSQMNAALENATELLINLYAYELSAYESQYLGTTLKYMWEILCTHEQETVLSWIMSLDENHMNRDCRTITLPADCSATLYEYRSQYGENLTNPEVSGPKVAEIVNGQLVTATLKDERIAVIPSGSNIVVRYPASLQIRTDITAGSAKTLNSFRVADYQTTNATIGVSLTEADQYQKLPANVRSGSSSVFSDKTSDTSKTNASSVNSALTSSRSLQPGETLSITADSISSFDASNTSTYTVSLYRAPQTVVAEYAMKTELGSAGNGIISKAAPNFTVSNGKLIYQPTAPSETAGATYARHEGKTFTEKNLDTLADSVMLEESKSGLLSIRKSYQVVNAGSVYYDDTLLTKQATVSDGKQSYTAAVNSTAVTTTDVTKENLISLRFTGTRIDVFANTTKDSGYIMASILNEDGTQYTNASGKLYNAMIGTASNGDLYNLPVISFSDMDYGTYILAIVVPQGKTFALDGVRVYSDPVQSRVAYFPVREMLLSAENWAAGEANGSVYLDYEQTETGEVQTYEESGPKGEVYLKPNSGVAFTIADYDGSSTYRIGLGAVTNQTTSAKVSSGSWTRTYTLQSPTHMFFDLQPDSSGNVVILNNGTAILSVTDIEVTYPEPTLTRSLNLKAAPTLMTYASSFQALPEAATEPEETTAPVETAAPEETTAPTEDPVVTPEPTPSPTPAATPEPTPTPTNPSSDSSVLQLISSFVKSLFGGFSRLFRP